MYDVLYVIKIQKCNFFFVLNIISEYKILYILLQHGKEKRGPLIRPFKNVFRNLTFKNQEKMRFTKIKGNPQPTASGIMNNCLQIMNK